MKNLHQIQGTIPAVYRAWAEKWRLGSTKFIWKDNKLYVFPDQECNMLNIQEDEEILKEKYPYVFNDPRYIPKNLKIL